MMEELASRKKPEKKELSEDEKFISSLQTEVSTYMTLHKASYFGVVKNVEKILSDSATAQTAVAPGKATNTQQTDAYDTDTGNTPLILAARNGNLKVVQLLIEQGKANANLAGYSGLTALHHACKNDHSEVVSYLLEQGKANVNAEDDAGNSAISYCARVGALQCMELLSLKNGDISHSNKHGSTPLMLSVLNARIGIIDWLLKKQQSLNLNHQDKEGSTALHYAAKCGFTRVVKQLLSLPGIKTTIVNTDGHKAEDVALNETIKAMIRAGAP